MKIKPIKPRAAAPVKPPGPPWQLRLYVIGETEKSRQAFTNLKEICEAHLKDHYRITVIDLLKHPQLAKGDQILAVPTVVRLLPKPVRVLIGTFSETARVLVGLDLRVTTNGSARA